VSIPETWVTISYRTDCRWFAVSVDQWETGSDGDDDPPRCQAGERYSMPHHLRSALPPATAALPLALIMEHEGGPCPPALPRRLPQRHTDTPSGESRGDTAIEGGSDFYAKYRRCPANRKDVIAGKCGVVRNCSHELLIAWRTLR